MGQRSEPRDGRAEPPRPPGLGMWPSRGADPAAPGNGGLVAVSPGSPFLALREKDYPTGVQVSGGGVALPHTDAKHATQNTLAVVTLNNPIIFQPMGGDGDEVEATTIVFLVFSDPKQHLKSLSKMVKAIQSEEFLTALHAAENVEDMQVVLDERLW